MQVSLEEGVPVFSFFWGDPAGYREPAHDAGAVVMHTVSSAQEARRTVEAGTDVVVAQGWEAGGHVWGEVATFALVPRVVGAVSPTPVVAAGGIADGRGLAAALALGAAGVWLGTRFIASEETPFAPMYKDRIAAAAETDTVYSSLFDLGWPDAPHRTLRNSTIDRWEAAGRPSSGSRPGEGETVATGRHGAPIRRYEEALPDAETSGDLEALALYAGQSCGLISSVEPAGEIVRRLVAEAVQTLDECARLVESN
jgi:nitronate monooxygenase